MADESLPEIQLDGKQLIFVFMAVTVVAVVIFLSGVMVGQTVVVEPVILAATGPETDLDGAATSLTPTPALTAPVGGPVAANEIITYPSYLESAAPPEETIGEVPPTVIESIEEPGFDLVALNVADDVDKETPDGGAVSSPDFGFAGGLVAGAAALQERTGDGFVVQVAAVSERPAAEAIAGDLNTKGYPAFVTTPGPDAPLVFRVRVGRYPDRRDAEAVAGRLEREEQFRPWITR